MLDGKFYCRHCNQRVGRRPRGLCWICYYLPGVRERYPPEPEGDPCPDFNGPARKPEPTAARAGTAAKFDVLKARAAAGQDLFHPADGPVFLDDEGRVA